MNRNATFALLSFAVGQLLGCAPTTINTGTLLGEMTDLNRLAEWPVPAYKTVQFSSYDRRSSVPGGPGWFANSDGFGREPIPGFEAVLREPGDDGIGEYLICDVEGPGAIVRTWTAAINGEIRLYLDGRREPLYEGPAADFLSFPYEAIAAGEHSQDLQADGLQQHQAAYCPIPFAKGCRMVWIGDAQKVHFYQVQIRRYEPRASVRAFKPEDLITHSNKIWGAADDLRIPKLPFAPPGSETPKEFAADIPPGAQVKLIELEGPRSVIWLDLEVSADDIDRSLRQTVMSITFDDHPSPQVEAPVGDFFGAAPGINPFRSVPLRVNRFGGMISLFVMPFEKSMRMTLINRGAQPVTVKGSFVPSAYTWTDRSMHFHARWRADHGVLGSPQGVQDMPFLIANGAGRYVGTALMLMNPCDVPTPGGGWWGEGDEKIFVDDDRVPSTFGTGSEDYFNYAWSVPDIFYHGYCGQPRNDGYGNRGFVTNHRWHILDDLPFRDRFAFYMELYPHRRVPGMSYARIAYYYARPGTIDDHVPITDEDLRHLELPERWEPAAESAMRGTVYHAVEDLVRGDDEELVPGRLWAGGRLMQWRPDAQGDALELRFPIPKEGKYRLHLGLALTPQAGRISVKIDGEVGRFASDGSIDLHVPFRTLARQFSSQDALLSAGEHTMTLTFDGAPDDVAEPILGLDYLAIQPR